MPVEEFLRPGARTRGRLFGTRTAFCSLVGLSLSEPQASVFLHDSDGPLLAVSAETFAGIAWAVAGCMAILILRCRLRALSCQRRDRREIDLMWSGALDLLCLTDRDGRLRRVNPRWTEVLGYDRDELEGQLLFQFVHQDDRAATESTLSRLVSGLSVDGFCNRYRAKDGSLRWLSWRARVVDGVILGAASDVTESRLLSDRLAETQARAAAILQVMPDLLLILDQQLEVAEILSSGRAIRDDRDEESPARALNQAHRIAEALKRHQTSFELSGFAIGELGARSEGAKMIRLALDEEDAAKVYEARLEALDAGRLLVMVRDVTQLVQQSRQLHLQNREQKLILDTIPGGIYRCKIDQHWTMIWVSNGLEHITGYPANAFIHNRDMSYAEIIHPEDRPRVQQLVTEALSRRKPFEMTYRIIRKDGSSRWIKERGARLPGYGDDADSLIGFLFDVTEEEQRRRELHAILDAMPAYIFYKDDNNTILATNRQAAQSLGLTPEEVAGRRTEEFFPMDDAIAYLRDDQEVLRSGVAKLGIIEDYEPPGGEIRRIRTDKVPLIGPSGTYDRLLAIASDITELTHAEMKARHLQERLSLAIKAASIGLWDYDNLSNSLFVGESTGPLLGFGAEGFRPTLKTWSERIWPSDRISVLRSLAAHLRGRAPIWTSEHRLKCADGSWLWVRVVGEVVERTLSKRPRRIVGVLINIQDLRVAVEDALAASRAKGEFLANMSHEIRTPMAAILGYADLLGTDINAAEDPDRAAEAIDVIRKNAHHLLHVVNDILDVSKIEAGRVSVEPLEVDPVTLAVEVLDLLMPRANEKNLQLRIRGETPLPVTIKTDPVRLRQILLNLIGNAIKFTDSGTVTLHVSCDQEAETLCFRIVDTGIGMTPDQCTAIRRFEAFTQADSSMTRRFGGTGLGLRISYGLVQLLGGHLEVSSELGKGSTFQFWIATGALDGVPMGEVPPMGRRLGESRPQRRERSEEERCALAGLRIYLAEDGLVNQRLVRHYVESAGGSIEIGDNGQAAVDRYAATERPPPDLFLMDMQMPILDGYAATRTLRALGCDRPVIALTAHAMESDRRECLEAGCDEHLVKPIDRRVLIETIQRLIALAPRLP